MILWRVLETIFASVNGIIGFSLVLLVITVLLSLLIPVVIVFCIYMAFIGRKTNS